MCTQSWRIFRFLFSCRGNLGNYSKPRKNLVQKKFSLRLLFFALYRIKFDLVLRKLWIILMVQENPWTQSFWPRDWSSWLCKSNGTTSKSEPQARFFLRTFDQAWNLTTFCVYYFLPINSLPRNITVSLCSLVFCHMIYFCSFIILVFAYRFTRIHLQWTFTDCMSYIIGLCSYLRR